MTDHEQYRRQDIRFKLVQLVLRYEGLSADDILSLSYALEEFVVGDETVIEAPAEEAPAEADASEGGLPD